MKIELEGNELDYIDKINKDLSTGNCPPLFVNQIGKEYYINFTCLDLAKANNFIMELLRPANIYDNITGIHVNSINYCHGDNKITELKSYLKSFLDQLENI